MAVSALIGWTLVIGSVAFAIGAGNPSLARAWTAPRPAFLAIVAAHPSAWRFTTVMFLVSTVLVAAGLAALPILLPDDTSRVLSAGGAAAYLLAALLWIVTLLHRLAVTPHAAAVYASSGVTGPDFDPLDSLNGALFKGFIVIGSAALATLGIALALGGLAPVVIGWGAAILSCILVVGLILTGDMPPFTLYIAPLAFGIVLVLR